ncbi:MAG TPA: glycosyltransferase family 2 protein [Acetobacteraceae bacterium]|jgi:GT2 family glycosyltransferase|nr:glycosyltransferase family 2 protein [Acetobacteraceae bacterium]
MPAGGATETAGGLAVVIVLHFNGLADTIACLETLAPQMHAGLEVLVVDNGSAETAGPVIAARFPGVVTLGLSVNRGWAGGNNAGIAWAQARGADVMCLLNNDTLVPEGNIDRLVRIARTIGPCLLHPAIDYADLAEGVQLDPSVAPNATKLPGHDGIYELSWAYGACLVVPAAVFQRIGLLDERFFLQLEETDFYERAKRVGLRSLCVPAVRITHKESRSFGGRRTPLKLYYMARNRLLLTEKHDRSLAGYIRTIRRIIWDGARTRGHGRQSLAMTLLWLLSADAFAASLRRGVWDYVRRRFGAYRA